MMRVSHELHFCYFSADQADKISCCEEKGEFNKWDKNAERVILRGKKTN